MTTLKEAAAWSKLEGYAARFSLVLHLVRVAANDPALIDSERIDEVSIKAGTRCWCKDIKRRCAFDRSGAAEIHRDIVCTRVGWVVLAPLAHAAQVWTGYFRVPVRRSFETFTSMRDILPPFDGGEGIMALPCNSPVRITCT